MAPISTTRLKAFQKPFLISCLREGIRTDGRGLTDCRPITFRFSFTDRGHAEVTVGETKVLCCISGEVVRPRPDNPSEGQVFFNVDLSPMANSDFDIRLTPGTLTHERVSELSLMIESLLKKSRAVDTEALCVEGGAKVWSLNVELRVLDDDGNIKDATALAALAGLLHFRRKKEIEYRGMNRNAERLPPTPLSIHHMPVLVTLCFIDDNGTFVVDPNREEEAISTGQISIAVNQFKELCAVRKAGGLPISSDILRYAIQIAAARSVTIIEQLMMSLKAHDTEREARRKNIWKKYLEADPVIIPVNSKEDKTMVEANDEINELDMEALEVSSSMKCADLLKSKIKRKKKKLLRKVKDRNASLSQQQSSEGEIILSPPTTPREVVTLPRPKKEEVVVRESFTVDSDNVDESFTEAIIKKKGKKR